MSLPLDWFRALEVTDSLPSGDNIRYVFSVDDRFVSSAGKGQYSVLFVPQQPTSTPEEEAALACLLTAESMAGVKSVTLKARDFERTYSAYKYGLFRSIRPQDKVDSGPPLRDIVEAQDEINRKAGRLILPKVGDCIFFMNGFVDNPHGIMLYVHLRKAMPTCWLEGVIPVVELSDRTEIEYSISMKRTKRELEQQMRFFHTTLPPADKPRFVGKTDDFEAALRRWLELSCVTDDPVGPKLIVMNRKKTMPENISKILLTAGGEHRVFLYQDIIYFLAEPYEKEERRKPISDD